MPLSVTTPEDGDTHSNDSQSPDDSVKSALQNITTILNNVVERMDRVERQLSQQNHTPSSSSSEKSARKKPAVPLILRSEVRKTYSMLIENMEDDFEGFDLDPSSTFNSPPNQAVVTRLIKEVLANNPQFQSCQIRDAVYTYYRTKSQEQSLKQRGKFDDRTRTRRRRERLLRKLQERSSILKKSTMAEKTKEKWNKALIPELISSEESDHENEDAVFVKQLPWRADLVNDFFSQLDSKVTESKSVQARRQRKKRITSTTSSTREIPLGLPKWAVKS